MTYPLPLKRTGDVTAAVHTQEKTTMNIKIAKTAPANTKDPRKVYIGGESPSFGPIRKASK